MKLPSLTEEFFGTQNTSNNGYRYVPGENETENLSDIVYKNVHSILKKSIIKSSSLAYSYERSYIADSHGVGIDESIETEEPNIEIVITQDITNGCLFFDIIDTDGLQAYKETNKNRKLLAVSGPDQTVLINSDSNSSGFNSYPTGMLNERQPSLVRIQENENILDGVTKTNVFRRPYVGDNINRTPGILHVPHINHTSSKDKRKVNFQSADEACQNRRGRMAFRHKDSHYHRSRDQRCRENEVKNRRSNIQVSQSPSKERNTFYGIRYLNTNTYCSSDACGNAEQSRQANIKQNGKHIITDGHVKNNKTGESHSEGDLIKQRLTSFRDMSNEKKTIPKRDQVKNVSVVSKHERKMNTNTKDNESIISGPTGDFEKNKNIEKQSTVTTKSITISGSHPASEIHDHKEGSDSGFVDKPKTKKKRNRSNRNKKIEKPKKTKIQVLQHQIELGQLKSFFSKYKTEGLKNIKLVEEMHVGTYSTKYKASYHNELTVLAVYSDQDVSDIAAVDMAHMRGSYFVQSLKDCIRGPCASLWLLTPFYRLGDLQKLLLRDEPRHVFGERQAQFITASLLIAIQYLHKNNIVHGNIKPSKILLNNQGFPVLTGFLKVYEGTTAEKRDVYTPAYAAPERFRGERGEAVDIFSVGCIAYEIITGRTPFDGGNVDGTKIKILSTNYQPWFEPEFISYAGEEFLELCLKKKASERFSLSDNINNMKAYEWFTRINFSELRRQIVLSPILDAIQLLNNHAKLSWEEKVLYYNWGCVMDEISPDRPSIGD